MSNHLSTAELAELRAQLEAKRAHLQQQIGALRTAEGANTPPIDEPSTDAPEDSGEQSVDMQAQDTERAVEADMRAQLVAVTHALAKFDTGAYGLCERCGKPIPLARLRRLPEARYDIEHQAEAEAKGRA